MYLFRFFKIQFSNYSYCTTIYYERLIGTTTLNNPANCHTAVFDGKYFDIFIYLLLCSK